MAISPLAHFTLPFPPSVNSYWRRNGGRYFISARGKKFRATVVAQLRALHLPTLAGRLRLVINFYPPDRRRRDLDNMLKALLDALEHGGLYNDDNQVCRLEIERKEPRPKDGAAEVWVYENSGE